ncbi:hypothetical protein DKZ23_09190, partial [Limosilactobacillus reuteri]
HKWLFYFSNLILQTACLKLFEKGRKKFKFFQTCSCDNYKLLNESIFTPKPTNYHRFIFTQMYYLETVMRE